MNERQLQVHGHWTKWSASHFRSTVQNSCVYCRPLKLTVHAIRWTDIRESLL